MPSQSEVMRMLDGDREAAVAQLFSAHRERLGRIVHFRLDPRLRGRVDPEDVLQEAYLDAAKRIDHYIKNPVTSIFMWFRLIVGQTVNDVYRRHCGAQMRDAHREVHLAAGHSTSSVVSMSAFLVGQLTSPSQAAMRQERSQQLTEALAGLDSLDQEVLALRHFEQLSNTEAAEVLQIEPGAAATRYFRAIRRLKSVLEKIPDFA